MQKPVKSNLQVVLDFIGSSADDFQNVAHLADSFNHAVVCVMSCRTINGSFMTYLDAIMEKFKSHALEKMEEEYAQE